MGVSLVARLLRVDSDGEARLVAQWIQGSPDSSLRGWAAVLPPLDGATVTAATDLATENRVRFAVGEAGVVMAGSLPSLRWIGLALAGNLHPPAAAAGEQLRDWADAAGGRPPPLRLRGRVLDWSHPVVMGIVNVTPDSFSDGGRFLDPAAAVAHGLALVAAGAGILDIGGESTRPRGATYGIGAIPVSDEEEIARVVPVVRGLREKTAVLLSVDTRKAAVAEAALAAGADLVNDVTGLLHDARIAEVVRRHDAGLVLMHTPADIEPLSHERPSDDLVGEVVSGLEAALARAAKVDRARVMLDPGIGFGKSAAHNLFLLRHAEAIAALGLPVVVGASRKASIARAASGGDSLPPPEDRLGASLGAAVVAYLSGAHVLRVHDVRETVQALRVAAATVGADAG